MKTLHLSREAIDARDPAALVAEIFACARVVVWTAPTLDLRGEVCPFTFVRTKLALEAMPAGARLRVVVDHEPAAANVPRSATAWGQSVLQVERLDASWEIWIERVK